MVADTLARLAPGGRSRRIAFVALVALMVTIAGCGGAGPSNNTTGTDGGLDGTDTTDGGVDTGNETTDAGTGNETTGNETTGNETTDAGTGNETTGNETDGTMNETGTANVRVAHMSPDAPAVDVYVNNETFLENVTFGNISDYTEVTPGEYNVSITEAGNQSNVVFAENLTVEAENYTVTAVGEIGENGTEPFSVLVLQDGPMDEMMGNETGNETTTENGTEMNTSENASVRIVHASPDAGPVTIQVADSNTTLAENVTFGTATEYVEVPAGDYTLEIVPANDTETVVTTVDVTVEADTPYTAFAAGYVMEDTAVDAPFAVYLAIDDPEAAMMGDSMEGGNETTTEEDNSTSISTATLLA